MKTLARSLSVLPLLGALVCLVIADNQLLKPAPAGQPAETQAAPEQAKPRLLAPGEAPPAPPAATQQPAPAQPAPAQPEPEARQPNPPPPPQRPAPREELPAEELSREGQRELETLARTVGDRLSVDPNMQTDRLTGWRIVRPE